MYVSAELFVGLPIRKQNTIACDAAKDFKDRILDLICNALDVTNEELTGKTKKRNVTEARCIAIGIILGQSPNYGLKKLGQVFGGRDHSTVLYHKDLYKDLYGTNKQFTYKANLVLKGLDQ